MKYLPILLFLSGCISAYSQVTNPQKAVDASTWHRFLDTGTTTISTATLGTTTTFFGKRDTVYSKAIFVVANMLHCSNYEYGLSANNYFDKIGSLMWVEGYVVQEKHNTSEGVMDPGGQMCVDGHGNLVSCWSDYWVTVGYLDSDKKPISKSIKVLQCEIIDK